MIKEKQAQIAIEIIRLLNGVSIQQASDILEMAGDLILDSQEVDANSPRCRAKFEELGLCEKCRARRQALELAPSDCENCLLKP